MSWPIGYARSGGKYSGALDGTIHLNGVAVTSPGGWMYLEVPSDQREANDPSAFDLRVRLSVDAAGYPFLYAEEIVIGGRQFAGLYAAAKALGSTWLAMPVQQARRAFEACARQSERPPAEPTRHQGAREVRSLGADETWRGAPSPVRIAAIPVRRQSAAG